MCCNKEGERASLPKGLDVGLVFGLVCVLKSFELHEAIRLVVCMFYNPNMYKILQSTRKR